MARDLRVGEDEGPAGSHEDAWEVLAAAAVPFADVPGVEVSDEGDIVRAIAPGWPYPFLNVVARLRLDGAAFAERVARVEAPFRAAGNPVCWWVSDGTVPADAEGRLAALGAVSGGEEALMAIGLDPPPAAVREEAARAARAGVTVAPVETRADLDAWVGVMADAYGWSDPAKATALARLYDPLVPHGRSGRRPCVLARLGGRAVGAASLFEAAGRGWVTNVGTVPAARGRGVGAAVTAAALELSTSRGHRAAWLAASAMGEPLYRRLGFVAVGRLAHLVGPTTAR